MAAENGEFAPTGKDSKLISPETLNDDQIEPIHHGTNWTEEDERLQELKQIFIANGRHFEKDPFSDEALDPSEIEERLFTTGLANIAFRLNQEARLGTIGLDEIIEAARSMARLIDDDIFEEKLPLVAETIDKLTPGSYVFPIRINQYELYGDIDATETVDDGNGPARNIRKCARVGTVKAEPDGQPEIIPRIWVYSKAQSGLRVGIALNVVVDLGDGTDFEIETDPFEEVPENIAVDRHAIRSALRSYIPGVLRDMDILEIQALADGFGTIGDGRLEDKLHGIAHERAHDHLNRLLNGENYLRYSRAVDYFKLYDPTFLEQEYEAFALDYALSGALFGSDEGNSRAQLFFRAYTDSEQWVADGMDRDRARGMPFEDSSELPELVRIHASQRFLERGRQLLEADLAQAQAIADSKWDNAEITEQRAADLPAVETIHSTLLSD